MSLLFASIANFSYRESFRALHAPILNGLLTTPAAISRAQELALIHLDQMLRLPQLLKQLLPSLQLLLLLHLEFPVLLTPSVLLDGSCHLDLSLHAPRFLLLATQLPLVQISLSRQDLTLTSMESFARRTPRESTYPHRKIPENIPPMLGKSNFFYPSGSS